MLNPVVRTLPKIFIVPLDSAEELAPTVDLLFTEAFHEESGRQAAVNRLAKYFLILLLRVALKGKTNQGGVVAGLADLHLAGAIEAIHARPEHAWSLEELAEAARMSRARFAAHFREVVGLTPFEYLADWRIGIAQGLLKRGTPVKIVAPTVGYLSPAAFSRVFFQRVGASPKEWLGRGVSASTL